MPSSSGRGASSTTFSEDPKADRIAGSVLGVVDLDGSAHWTELTDQDGGSFRGKIEGLSRGFRDARKVHFVIEDDEIVSSEIVEGTLSEGFFHRTILEYRR